MRACCEIRLSCMWLLLFGYTSCWPLSNCSPLQLLLFLFLARLCLPQFSPNAFSCAHCGSSPLGILCEEMFQHKHRRNVFGHSVNQRNFQKVVHLLAANAWNFRRNRQSKRRTYFPQMRQGKTCCSMSPSLDRLDGGPGEGAGDTLLPRLGVGLRPRRSSLPRCAFVCPLSAAREGNFCNRKTKRLHSQCL